MKSLTIYYDGRCGLCGVFRRWHEGKERSVEVRFEDLHAVEDLRMRRVLTKLKADEEIVVRDDAGNVWQGAGAWVVALWVLPEYRGWAERFSSPVLMPMVRKFVKAVSARRLKISELMGLSGDRELGRVVNAVEEERGCRLR